MLDIEAIRKDFPILDQEVNGKPLAYLDNAATTQKPKAVIDTIEHYYLHDNANVHRGLHTLSERASLHFDKAREKLAHFINAANFKECIFVRGVTEGINLIAQSFVRPRIRPGEAILVTDMEHHANIVPWQIVCHQTGATLRHVPINDFGELDLEALDALLTPDIKILALTHISNALGTINPIKEVISMAHDRGVVVVVDGAQGAPHTPIDVQDLDCDFYLISGHKMYAPTGIGLLYGKQALLEDMPPYQGGGDMILNVTFEKTEYNALPYKFEAGTPNISGAIAMGTAVDYINHLGLDNIAAYEKQLLDYALSQIGNIKGIGLIGTAKEKAGIISFVMQNIHAHDIGTILNNAGIAVRSGHHCAMPLMDRFQVPATTRVSFAFYNTEKEIDQLMMALQTASEVFG